MAYKPLFPFPNTAVNTPFVFSEREKGFGERFGEDLANMTWKQGIGLPFSVPLQGGMGALKGASFGLLNFTDDAQDALGDFGLPDTVSSALHIAGEIGGSFVPFIGASKVAHKVFQGLGLAADLARGATTFGAPELARQALTQEFSPQAGARSLATGAAFALPLPRIALAPAVAGTELLLGAEPLEAAAAGLFAALFGSMSKKPKAVVEEVASEIPHHPVGEKLGIFQQDFRKAGEVVGGSPAHYTAGWKLAQDGLPGAPRAPKNVFQEVMREELNTLSLRGKGVTPADRIRLESSKKGQMQLFPVAGGGRTQAEVMNEIVIKNSGTKLGENVGKLVKQVEHEAATKSSSQLSLELDNFVLTKGPTAVETNVARWALAEKKGHFVPEAAPVTNELAKIPQLRGINMVDQGPGNQFIVRAENQKLLTTLRSGPRTAQLKAMQIQNIVQEAQDGVRRARGRGQELEPGKMAELTIKMEAALASKEVGIRTQDDARALMRDMMGQHTTPEAVIALAKDPPPEIRKVFPGPQAEKVFQKMAEDRAQVLKYVFEETGARQFRPESRRISPGLDDLRRKASDHGMQVTVRPRFTRGKGSPFQGDSGSRTTAGREILDNFQMTLGGQNVRKFKSIKAANAWVTALETGKIDPTDIHELRALAHPRSIDVVYNGNGTVTLTNTMSGETFQGAKTLKEATEVVRQAPNIASATREIGPPVPVGTHPPLSGTGSIGSIAAEQPPPADICGMPALLRGL